MNESLIDTVGKTPLVHMARFAPEGQLFGKLENRNPLFCVKCRTAWGMIRRAERENLLKPGATVVEPTSGNTGIGLGWVCAIRGYKLKLTMPESMSVERRRIVEFLGAELVLTDAARGMPGAIEKAKEIAESEGAYLPDQFSNPGNVEIHEETTGPEIWKDMEGKVDIAVFGVGTGGTLTGAGRFLKKQNPNVKLVAVEPVDSPVLSGGQSGKHMIQGIGAGFIPAILDTSLIDEVRTVSNQQSIDAAREMGTKEGFFCGISCGAAAYVAREIAKEHPNARVVTVLPDLGERYLSTVLFQ